MPLNNSFLFMIYYSNEILNYHINRRYSLKQKFFYCLLQSKTQLFSYQKKFSLFFFQYYCHLYVCWINCWRTHQIGTKLIMALLLTICIVFSFFLPFFPNSPIFPLHKSFESKQKNYLLKDFPYLFLCLFAYLLVHL